MEFAFITKIVAFLVAAYVVYEGYTAMQKASGKTKSAINLIVVAVAVLGGLEFLSIIGYAPTDEVLRPLFWDLDIITSICLLGAIRALPKK